MMCLPPCSVAVQLDEGQDASQEPPEVPPPPNVLYKVSILLWQDSHGTVLWIYSSHPCLLFSCISYCIGPNTLHTRLKRIIYIYIYILYNIWFLVVLVCKAVWLIVVCWCHVVGGRYSHLSRRRWGWTEFREGSHHIRSAIRWSRRRGEKLW